MNRRHFSTLLAGTTLASTASKTLAAKAEKPNLLVIHTDEHNFRTLGCYRDLLGDDQAYVWGKGIKVDTPHIDRIAREGAICTSYFASSPVCTPSRASFVTGLYPVATGSPKNEMPLHDGLGTFASVLHDQGYATSYVGKWHLDGDAKPGFEPPRKFGFSDNRYMMNRGHWKGLGHDKDGKPVVLGLVPNTHNAKFNVSKSTEEDFTTDYLTSRVLEIMERDKKRPFAIMLSIPDPHTPNLVRPPYDKMYDNLHFENPRTMQVDESTMPKWALSPRNVDHLEQNKMQDYFGMVKCIDDNVGRLLKFLEENKLADNTIVIFTSDHGDLMGEHRKHNKGMPFETSAKIPFVIRWPKGIAAGKRINSPYTTADFPPTILGIMGAPQIQGEQHGINDAKAFLSKKKVVDSDRVTYMTMGGWVAAVTDRYKYVLSPKDVPWLFDVKKDPDELINFAKNPEYAGIAAQLEKELLLQIELYKDPILKSKQPLKLSTKQI